MTLSMEPDGSQDGRIADQKFAERTSAVCRLWPLATVDSLLAGRPKPSWMGATLQQQGQQTEICTTTSTLKEPTIRHTTNGRKLAATSGGVCSNGGPRRAENCGQDQQHTHTLADNNKLCSGPKFQLNNQTVHTLTRFAGSKFRFFSPEP